MGKKSRSKKEATEAQAAASGQSTARKEKATEQILSRLTLEDKPKQQQKPKQQDEPSTSGQSQQKQGGPSGQAQTQPQSQGQPGSARGPGQQPQQRPAQGGPQTQSGQQPRAQDRGQSQPQQQQRSAQSAQQQGSASAWGQGQQQRPAQGGQQQRPAQGGQQQQQRSAQSGQPQQQQRPPQGGQQPQSARGPQQQQPAQSGQQPSATVWSQRPAPGGQATTQAAGSSGQKPQQRAPQGPRPAAQGKGDQKTHTPKPAIISYDYKICEYKGPGTLGKPVKIETNYLKLDVSKLAPHAFHYDVSIDFEPAGRAPPGKKFMHPVFAAFVKRNFPKSSLAYDGQKNAYAPVQLDLSRPYETVIQTVDDETGQQRSFKVEIKEVKGSLIDLSVLKDYRNVASIDIPMRAIQCLDIVLKAAFQNRQFNGKLVGRSFYMRPEKQIDLGDFYEMWIGMFQSTILGRIPYVNVDVAHKAFPSRTELIDLIKKIGYDFRTRRDVNLNAPLDYTVINNLTTHLKGLDIGYVMPGGAGTKAYKFARLTEPANKVKFTIEGVETTVERYFQERGHRLRYPQLPCISTAGKSFFPVELCYVIGGQAVQKKTTENQTRAMIREAATSTDIRKDKILRILNQIKYNEADSVKGFGLRVDNEFAEIPARILDPPILAYAGNRTVRPARGEWRAENMEFIVPQKNINWGVLMLDNRVQESQVHDLCKMILRISPTIGMAFSQNYFVDVFNSRNDDRQLDRTLGAIKEKQCNVLFCVIPDRGDSYARVKQAAELRCGVLTQCIKAFTVSRKGNDGSTISNILLKVNAKLNGFNHKLQNSPILSKHKCMVIGADVTHPSPDQQKIPSVVGVAASHDRDAFKYNICWRLQDPRQEMIQDFQQIILEQLDYYKLKNNGFPDRILYFRDGVSEGQFTEIQNVELKALQKACQMKYGPDYEKKVKITMVVVQKRHHTRFFPGKSGIGKTDRKNNNVPPGTIVDQEITAPKENHFYLVSHQSIQGVAKPTKYCILHDEGNTLKIDELQTLTYDLCHLFTRCNRSVSYPAPTYYAHLAAYRGRVYIEGRNDLNMDNLDNEWKNRKIRDEIVKGHPMYFV